MQVHINKYIMIMHNSVEVCIEHRDSITEGVVNCMVGSRRGASMEVKYNLGFEGWIGVHL